LSLSIHWMEKLNFGDKESFSWAEFIVPAKRGKKSVINEKRSNINVTKVARDAQCVNYDVALGKMNLKSFWRTIICKEC
jgi:hypothetical protein